MRSLILSLGLALAAGPALSAQAAAVLPASAAGPTAGPMSLTPEAADDLRRQVLVQCGLPADQQDGLPWYFHFEYGRQLNTAGDARRAIGELSQSIEIDPKPGAAKRMYGVWYVDYLPYFQLAQAHARLGNWPCAANALTLSQRYDEARFGVLDPTVVTALTDEVKRESAAAVDAGSCRKEDFIDPAYAGDAQLQ
jgi:hypothetical protein